MMERGKRGYACPEQGVDEAIVEIKSRLVDCASTLRQHPRPGDGKAVGPEAELPHEGNVFLVAAVMIAGPVPAFSLSYCSRPSAKHVPD